MTRFKRVVYTVCAMLVLVAVWSLLALGQASEHAEVLREELVAVAHPSAEDEGAAADVLAGDGLAVVNPWIDELRQRNEDLLGWLTIPNTSIDYPVVQTLEDNDFYLTHDFNGVADSHGTLFADVASRVGEGHNLIVYGHHMTDGTMFQNLTKYQDADFCRTNDDVLFYTRGRTWHFRPVAVMRISVEEAEGFPYHTIVSLDDDAAYADYFARCKPFADWMAAELPTYPTMLLTLSTCEYSKQNSRLVVVCACTDS